MTALVALLGGGREPGAVWDLSCSRLVCLALLIAIVCINLVEGRSWLNFDILSGHSVDHGRRARSIPMRVLWMSACMGEGRYWLSCGKVEGDFLSEDVLILPRSFSQWVAIHQQLRLEERPHCMLGTGWLLRWLYRHLLLLPPHAWTAILTMTLSISRLLSHRGISSTLLSNERRCCLSCHPIRAAWRQLSYIFRCRSCLGHRWNSHTVIICWLELLRRWHIWSRVVECLPLRRLAMLLWLLIVQTLSIPVTHWGILLAQLLG